MQSEYIKVIRLNSSEKFQCDKTIRAVVLIVEDFSPENSFCEWLESFEIPVILALKNSANKELVAAVHLCVASTNAIIGISSAKEYLKLGLINKIVSLEEVEKEALLLAEIISSLAPLAIRSCMKAVNQGLQTTLEDGLKIESELFAQIFSTNDMREGTGAFLEKRKPIFKGQ